MKRITVVVVATTLAYGFAFRPSLQGTFAFWLVLAIPYAVLAALALHTMHQDGTLVDLLKPRWGDISKGVLIAALLLAASWAGRALLAPAGTPRQAWIFRVYLQLGHSEELQRSFHITALLFLIPLCEELVWRGMVLSQLTERLGTRRGWPIAALLYGAVTLPTLFGLSDPQAGPNPLLFIAALGGGMIWSFATAMMGRLPPVIISHVAFTYFTAVQFRWPGA